MRDVLQSEESSSKGEALQVRGRPEQKKYNNNKDKSKNGRGRSKSKGSGQKEFCGYCKKEGHLIDDCWKLENKEKRNGTWKPKKNLKVMVRSMLHLAISLIQMML
jgi:hypothetical protein